MLYFFLFVSTAFAAQNYIAERDPMVPKVKEQYRLILRTPDRSCREWRKVKPLIGKDDMLVSESKRDENGKPPGCRFLWVITPVAAAGDMRFELERMTGPTENFEVPVPGAGPKEEVSSAPLAPRVMMQGVANENGTGPATVPVRGSLKLPPMGESKSNDMGTGL